MLTEMVVDAPLLSLAAIVVLPPATGATMKVVVPPLVTGADTFTKRGSATLTAYGGVPPLNITVDCCPD
ncbi:MAG: hypothetical protein ACYDA5_03240 [Vulcanimicrobiaceae bacterium]